MISSGGVLESNYTSKSEDEFIENVRQVLKSLCDAAVNSKLEKYETCRYSIDYLWNGRSSCKQTAFMACEDVQNLINRTSASTLKYLAGTLEAFNLFLIIVMRVLRSR